MLTATATVESATPRPEGGADRRPPGGEAAVGEDEDERGDAERLGEAGVVEPDAQARLAQRHPDPEVDQQRGQADAGGQAYREHGDEDDARTDAEQEGQIVHVACPLPSRRARP